MLYFLARSSPAYPHIFIITRFRNETTRVLNFMCFQVSTESDVLGYFGAQYARSGGRGDTNGARHRLRIAHPLGAVQTNVRQSPRPPLPIQSSLILRCVFLLFSTAVRKQQCAVDIKNKDEKMEYILVVYYLIF